MKKDIESTHNTEESVDIVDYTPELFKTVKYQTKYGRYYDLILSLKPGKVLIVDFDSKSKASAFYMGVRAKQNRKLIPKVAVRTKRNDSYWSVLIMLEE